MSHWSQYVYLYYSWFVIIITVAIISRQGLRHKASGVLWLIYNTKLDHCRRISQKGTIWKVNQYIYIYKYKSTEKTFISLSAEITTDTWLSIKQQIKYTGGKWQYTGPNKHLTIERHLDQGVGRFYSPNVVVRDGALSRRQTRGWQNTNIHIHTDKRRQQHNAKVITRLW